MPHLENQQSYDKKSTYINPLSHVCGLDESNVQMIFSDSLVLSIQNVVCPDT